uniref:Uncharacterized protein n=1 Tax=Rhizophora mucronata TaxID=61149 RepID=A0A2P2P7J8_RHIMU
MVLVFLLPQQSGSIIYNNNIFEETFDLQHLDL